MNRGFLSLQSSRNITFFWLYLSRKKQAAFESSFFIIIIISLIWLSCCFSHSTQIVYVTFLCRCFNLGGRAINWYHGIVPKPLYAQESVCFLSSPIWGCSLIVIIFIFNLSHHLFTLLPDKLPLFWLQKTCKYPYCDFRTIYINGIDYKYGPYNFPVFIYEANRQMFFGCYFLNISVFRWSFRTDARNGDYRWRTVVNN